MIGKEIKFLIEGIEYSGIICGFKNDCDIETYVVGGTFDDYRTCSKNDLKSFYDVTLDEKIANKFYEFIIIDEFTIK